MMSPLKPRNAAWSTCDGMLLFAFPLSVFFPQEFIAERIVTISFPTLHPFALTFSVSVHFLSSGLEEWRHNTKIPNSTSNPFTLSSLFSLCKESGIFLLLVMSPLCFIVAVLALFSKQGSTPLHPIEIAAIMYVLCFQKKSLPLLIALIYSSKKKIARKNVLNITTLVSLVDAESLRKPSAA